MADTPLTLSQIITALADTGSAGRITPATLRQSFEGVALVLQGNVPPNLVPNPFASGAVVGSAGGGAGTFSGTLPTGASALSGAGQGNLVAYVAAVGVSANGHPYWDLNLSGTTSTTGIAISLAGNGGPNVSGVPITAASYTFGAELSFSAGDLTNISSVTLEFDAYSTSNAFVNTLIFSAASITGTPTTFSFAGTANATSLWGVPSIVLSFSSGVQIGSTPAGVRIRIANPQVLLTSTSAAYTAALADSGIMEKVNAPAAFTVTIPPNVFSSGTQLPYLQSGAGAVTLLGGTGVTLVSATGTLTTRAQGSLIWATADSDVPNLWWVAGDLS